MFNAEDCGCLVSVGLHGFSQIAALVAASIVTMDDNDCFRQVLSLSFNLMECEKPITII